VKPLYRGLLLGAVHLGIVSLLGGKLLYDRATCPRIWVRTAPVDPSLPLRGRYVDLRVQARARGLITTYYAPVALRVEGSELVAVPDPHGNRPLGGSNVTALEPAGVESSPPITVDLGPPLAFFIPEHVPDPSRRKVGEELWVEVTVPRSGPPRPIRLGVKRGRGPITPL
jgi:hypothetical protein